MKSQLPPESSACPAHTPRPVHLDRPLSSADVSCLQILRRLLIKVWQVKVKSTLNSSAAFGNGWLQEEHLILTILTAGFLLFDPSFPCCFYISPWHAQALLNARHFQEGYFWHPHDNKL